MPVPMSDKVTVGACNTKALLEEQRTQPTLVSLKREQRMRGKDRKQQRLMCEARPSSRMVSRPLVSGNGLRKNEKVDYPICDPAPINVRFKRFWWPLNNQLPIVAEVRESPCSCVNWHLPKNEHVAYQAYTKTDHISWFYRSLHIRTVVFPSETFFTTQGHVVQRNHAHSISIIRPRWQKYAYQAQPTRNAIAATESCC